MGHNETAMRTNIEIDDELIREALRVSGLKTKRAAVEAGLKASASAGSGSTGRIKFSISPERFIGKAI
jgi:Arc/MetJ family transcription regulator